MVRLHGGWIIVNTQFTETFHKIFYKEWPIFRKLRKEAAFLTVYEECYSEPFIIEVKVVSKEIEAAPGNN
jgi:hypothetical protein